MLSETEISKDLEIITRGFNAVIRKIDHFSILDKQLVPEGLKPHTRSISWLAEQVIVQQARKNLGITGFDRVVASKSDIEQHDCVVGIQGNDCFVNLKVTNAAKKHDKNDINKAWKLKNIFSDNPDTRLYYAIFKIRFENVVIHFVPETPTVFYVPWIESVYVNPSNHHLQANYFKPPVKRTVTQFVSLIDKEIKIKGLPER